MKQPKKKAVKAWAGIVGNEIDVGVNYYVNFADLGLAIFKTRRAACRNYEKVVPVLISPITKKK